MVKNILTITDVQTIEKQHQKYINGKGFALDLPIGIACRRGDQICCGSGRGKCGLTGGIYDHGRCFCFPS